MGKHELSPATIDTADVAALATVDGHEYVLAVRRLRPPYAGYWALPGGHVDPGETTAWAALRECAEETGIYLPPASLVYVGTYDTPGRDPRGPYVTTAYTACLEHTPDVAGADDAAEARWLPIRGGELLSLPPLAFDHAWIVDDAQHVLRSAEGHW